MADPTDLNAPDPYVDQLIKQYRTQQLAQQIAAAQNPVGNPKNMGEGINALGTGFVNMLQGFKANAANQQNMGMANALAGGITPAAPLPAFTPRTYALPQGSTTPGSLPTPGSTAMATPPHLPAPLQASIPSSTEMAGGLSPVQQQIADTWRKAGANPTAIAGVLGNVGQESSFNPSISPNTEGGGGLYQHRGPRYQALLKQGDYSPAGQSAYAISELGGPYAAGLSIDKLNAARSPAEAAAIFERGFEKAGDPNMAHRQAIAEQLAGKLGGGPQVAAVNTPASYGVPAGQVAGPGIPPNLPAPIARPPAMAALSQTAVMGPHPGPAAPPTAMPEPSPQEALVNPKILPEEAPEPPPPSPVAIAPQPVGPTPSGVNPVLSPNPMGPPQSFTPPAGGGPGAAGVSAPLVAPPVSPQGPPLTAGAPPVAARPIPPSVAPATGGSAYDPRTGRFLAPGEQIPGYAPAPMSSTGGPGGLGGLLASLFGGTAQAAPARPPAYASGLAGGQPAPAPAPVQKGLPVAPQGGPPATVSPNAPGAPAAPAGVAPPAAGGAGPLMSAYNSQFNEANQRWVQLQRAATLAANTPWGAAYQKQADAARSDMEEARKAYMGLAAEKPEKFTRADGSEYLGDPRTGQPVSADIKGPDIAARPMTKEEAVAHGLAPEDAPSHSINPRTGLVTTTPDTADKTHTLSPEELAMNRLPPNAHLQVDNKGKITDIGGMKETNDIQNYQFYAEAARARGETPVPFEKYGALSEGEKGKVLAPGAKIVNTATGETMAENKLTSSLAPETLTWMADSALDGKPNVASNLGRGAQGSENLAALHNKITERAAERHMDPQDAIDNTTQYFGRVAGARTAGQMNARLDIFGESAKNAGNLAIEKSNNVPRGDWVPWNRLKLAAASAISDPDVAELKTATNTLINEYAKATTPVGQPTDSQRSHAEDVINMASSPETFQKTVELLQWEIANTQRAGERVSGKQKIGSQGIENVPPMLPTPGAGGGATAPGAAPPGPQSQAVPLSGEPLFSQAIRSGIPGANAAIAKAQTVLPAGYGGASPSYEVNLANMTARQNQFNQRHPYLTSAGQGVVVAPFAGIAGGAATPVIGRGMTAVAPYAPSFLHFLAKGAGLGAGFEVLEKLLRK